MHTSTSREGLVSPQSRLPSIQVVRSRAARAVRTEVLERKLTFTVLQWATTTQAKHGVIVTLRTNTGRVIVSPTSHMGLKVLRPCTPRGLP
jgi:hypothetical protein